MMKIKTSVVLLLFLIAVTSCQHAVKENDYLISFNDTVKDGCGYKNRKGDIVIPIGKYERCFTDTFKSYAIVALPKIGIVAIDRHQNVLYAVFPFDNGPDNASEGLFRIMANKKIGYADVATGAVVIQPQFDCAFTFENGSAKVSADCKTQSNGEHQTWLSDHWYYIDKKGQKTDKPQN